MARQAQTISVTLEESRTETRIPSQRTRSPFGLAGLLALATISPLGVGCKQAPQAPVHAEALEPPKPPAPPPSKCPAYTVTFKDGIPHEFCEVTYKSLKDATIDGEDAVWKRAKFPCRFFMVLGGNIICKTGPTLSYGIDAFIPKRLKEKVKTLKEGQIINVDVGFFERQIGSFKSYLFDVSGRNLPETPPTAD